MAHSRCIAHALHTTSNDNALVAACDRLRCQHDAFEATGAHLVDSGGIRRGRHAGAERDLAGGGLADAGLDNIAEVDLLDDIGADTSLQHVGCAANAKGVACCWWNIVARPDLIAPVQKVCLAKHGVALIEWAPI